MIIVLKENPEQKQLDNLVAWLKSMDMEIHYSQYGTTTIMGLIGETAMVDTELIEALDIVESVKRITEPYKNANRKFHPKDTIIDIGPVKLGGGHFAVIAGPCSIESMNQVCSIAEEVKAAGALCYTEVVHSNREPLPMPSRACVKPALNILLEAKRSFRATGGHGSYGRVPPAPL
jgi:3-deoxy-7-phosphoheptulonate synthase